MNFKYSFLYCAATDLHLSSLRGVDFTINNGAPLLLNLATGIFIFWKVLYFLPKITWDLLYLYCSFILHNWHCTYISHIKQGPLINSPYHRHLTPPLHSQPRKYMSANKYIFLSHDLCVYQYYKGQFVRRKIYSIALVF